MTDAKSLRKWYGWVTFLSILGLSVILGFLFGSQTPANAARYNEPVLQDGGYAGSDSCAKCHENIHGDWISTRHANAYSSPIFQRDWDELNLDQHCLECHTTGFDPISGEFAEEESPANHATDLSNRDIRSHLCRSHQTLSCVVPAIKRQRMNGMRVFITKKVSSVNPVTTRMHKLPWQTQSRNYAATATKSVVVPLPTVLMPMPDLNAATAICTPALVSRILSKVSCLRDMSLPWVPKHALAAIKIMFIPET